MRDRYNREISYLRISVTDRCNLRCLYCMPEEGVSLRRHDDMLSFEQIEAIVRAGVRLGITKVRLTGGEPLVRSGIVELVRRLASVRGLERLAMTTNGTLLPRFAPALRRAGLDSVNISLDTLDPDRYAELTRGGDVRAAVAGVEAARQAGFHPIKINVVVQNGSTDTDLPLLEEFCRSRGLLLQRIREYALSSAKQESAGYERPPRCGECNRLRLTADGLLKPCLHSDREIAVDFTDPERSLRETIASKPAKGSACTNRAMVAIGG
jgi:cyclic pyranopterin phosphate synthase